VVQWLHSKDTGEQHMSEIYEVTLNLVPEFVDSKTNEVNMTALAEAVCDQFNGYEGDEIPEVFFEAAYEAAENFYQSFAP
jgi:hypothetical protein